MNTKTPRLRFAAALFGAATLAVSALTTLLPGTARAQTAVTDPVGYTTLTAVPKQGTINGSTYISLNMVRPSAYRGLIPSGGASTSNGVTVLTFPANTFTDGQFTGAGNVHYLEIKNGSAAGIIANIDAMTSTTLTLGQDITSVITSGTTTFTVRPHWTFGTVFGANNTAGFQGSFTPSSADGIQIINPTTSVATNFYYNTSNNRWQNGGTDATNVVIPPNAGLLIVRKQTTPVNFTLVGEVKLGPTALFVQGGATPYNYNLVPNPYPLSSVTLATSNLYSGSADTGFVGSFTPSQADILSILDTSTGVATNYYYNTSNNRWQNGGADASNVVIPSGTSVLITRKNGRASFNWFVPQPNISL